MLKLKNILFPISVRYNSNTIYALSSGHGTCGVAVIRITGSNAGSALLQMTGQDKLPPPRRAQLKRLRHPISKDILDHALTFWLPGPHSFTGEDSAELQIHGGYAVTKAVLAALGSIPGLAPAQAGDFTKRAFHAGKLDLTQVEALADLIHAETDHQRRQALRQLDGNLMKQFELWRTRLIKIMANIEAYIDFAESEDIEETVPKEVHKDILELLEELKLSHKNAKSGERLRKGVHVAIVGKPNVGKSTLLNRIVQRPAAIVSPLAGTTRDVVETRLDLQGYPVVLFDTAGLREETNDIVEEEGVKRAINTGNSADILILVQDATSANENRTENFDLKEFGLEDIGQVKLNLMNKIDLNNNSHDSTAFGVSGLTGQGLDEFLDVLTDHVKELCETNSGENCPGLTRDRHKFHLSKAIDFIEEYLEQENSGSDLVICAHYLRKAVREIGHVSGKVSSEKILDVIFADFCIGK